MSEVRVASFDEVPTGQPMVDWRLSGHKGAYYETVLYTMDWKGFGEPYPSITCYRRPLEAMFNPLCDAGFVLDRVLEPRPVPEMRDVSPRLYDELSSEPCFLCIRARRP